MLFCRKPHIAFILLAVFSFPVVFQPLHIGWHKIHKGGERVVSSADIISPPELTQANDETRGCDICEFLFSVSNDPGFFVLRVFDVEREIDFSDKDYVQHVSEIEAHPSLRAPPLNLV